MAIRKKTTTKTCPCDPLPRFVIYDREDGELVIKRTLKEVNQYLGEAGNLYEEDFEVWGFAENKGLVPLSVEKAGLCVDDFQGHFKGFEG
jgi:hypothetical protein